MNKKTKEYLKHLKDLEYHEYSYKTETSHALLSAYKKNGKNNSVDLGLLDLSLDQNEDVYKKIFRSLGRSLTKAGQYTFAQNEELLELLSKKHKISPENILITAGCDGALRILSQMLINKGTKVCIPLPSFPRYEFHTKVNQGKITFVDPGDFPYQINLRNVFKECKKNKVDIVFLANPNNPTGLLIPKKEINEFLSKFNGYVIIDEALVISEKQSLINSLKKNKRLIITRSFSKMYGMAGLRIGYFIANKEIAELAQKLASPFEVASVAIRMAIESLKDDSTVKHSQRGIIAGIEQLKKFNHPKLEFSPTKTSTAIIKSTLKSNLYYDMLKLGVKTVSCKDFRSLENENCVRISIKNEDYIKKLVKKLSRLE